MKTRLLLIAVLFCVAQPSHGQQEQTPKSTEGQLMGASEDGAHAIGLLLRCPVCQGMPISDSPADMAQSMMAKVRTMHKEGQSEAEILKYFTDRYGDWVLLKPKASGFNWLVWLLPPLVLLAGIFVALTRGKSKSQNAEAADEDESQQDAYLEAIRKEVEL